MQAHEKIEKICRAVADEFGVGWREFMRPVSTRGAAYNHRRPAFCAFAALVCANPPVPWRSLPAVLGVTHERLRDACEEAGAWRIASPVFARRLERMLEAHRPAQIVRNVPVNSLQ